MISIFQNCPNNLWSNPLDMSSISSHNLHCNINASSYTCAGTQSSKTHQKHQFPFKMHITNIENVTINKSISIWGFLFSQRFAKLLPIFPSCPKFIHLHFNFVHICFEYPHTKKSPEKTKKAIENKVEFRKIRTTTAKKPET